MLKQFSLQLILSASCRHFKCKPEQLKKNHQRNLITEKRTMIFVMYYYGERNIKKIASFLGYADHTCISEYVNKILKLNPRVDIDSIIKICDNETITTSQRVA